VEPWYESSLQVIYGASLIASLFWLCQKTTHGFLRCFAWLSWLEALWLVVVALSREEWRILWLACGGAVKALLFPYLSRRWTDPEPASQPAMKASSIVVIFVSLATLSMFMGRAAGPLYRLNGEALGAVCLLCLSALFSVASRAASRLQLLSLAVLEGGFVLLGVHLNPQVPMGWVLASIVLLVVIFWRLSSMRADANPVEA
jgi:hydrogenase-4 membrane subunit HyfE